MSEQICKNCGKSRAMLTGDGGCLRKMNCGRTTEPTELDALIAEVGRLTATDAACGEIHIICADAGIPVGHVVQRVGELVQAFQDEIDRLRRFAGLDDEGES